MLGRALTIYDGDTSAVSYGLRLYVSTGNSTDYAHILAGVNYFQRATQWTRDCVMTVLFRVLNLLGAIDINSEHTTLSSGR